MTAVSVPQRHNEPIRPVTGLSSPCSGFSLIEDSYIQLSFLIGVTLSVDPRYVIGEQEPPVPCSGGRGVTSPTPHEE